MKEIWTGWRETLLKMIQSPQLRLFIQVRLLELALEHDARVSVEALKLLIPLAGEVGEELDPELAALDLDELEDALGRAAEYIRSVAGDRGESSDPYPTSVLGAEVLQALRRTKYADLPGGIASSDNNGGVGTPGSGDNQVSDH